MTDKRERLIFDLTLEHREALERVRVAMGLRSHAEVLRRLIDDACAEAAVRPPEPRALPDVRAKPPIPPRASLSGVQLGPTPRKPGDLAKRVKR